MRHLPLVFFILLLFPLAGIKAQQNHFLYIQTEGRQPFYVKLDKKIYSSSASGYLLISKLKTATYSLGIGFPKSEWTEQNIQCKIDDNDIGLLLKNFGSKGWGLFNLQTLDVIIPAGEKRVASIEVVNKTDAFSTMLSTVVNDSTIRQTEVVKEEIKAVPKVESNIISVAVKETAPGNGSAQSQKDELKQIPVEKTIIISSTPIASANSESHTVPVSAGLAEHRSLIMRSLLNNTSSGTEMIFIDDYGTMKDTIRIFIPADDKNLVESETKAEKLKKETPKSKSKSRSKRDAVKNKTASKEIKFIEIEPVVNNTKKAETKIDTDTAADQNKQAVDKQTVPVSQNAAMINSDCKANANNDDFLKLRKKMVAEDNDDDMVMIAKKVFKIKCFTVEQVKNLSVLFLKDSGKYSFFDMAYAFVSDSHNFSMLQNQLTETYYISRFQVMVRH